MRGLSLLTITLVVFGGLVGSTNGQMAPVSQSRSVKATLSGTYINPTTDNPTGAGYAPLPDQTQSAPDLSPFNVSVANAFLSPTGSLGAVRFSGANQSSQFGSDIISAAGYAFAEAAQYTSDVDYPLRWKYTGTAESLFEYSFSVATPTTVSLLGALGGNVYQVNGLPGAQASYTLSAADGTVIAHDTTPTVMNMTRPPSYESTGGFTTLLAPGSYTLSAEASATPALFITGPNDNENYRNDASFQFTLQAVPEPTIAALLPAALLVRRRRTLRRGR